MTVKSPPAPKPDHIRSLRDLAANFVRAIDRTAFEYEGAATADLTERVSCLVALHEFAASEPEQSKTPTADLRSRLNLLRQADNINRNFDWEIRQMSNAALKKRIEYLRQFADVESADDLEGFTDETLTNINQQSAEILRARRRKAKAVAKATAEAAADFRPDRLVTNEEGWPSIPDEEEGDEEAA
jgi:hypothetical protein